MRITIVLAVLVFTSVFFSGCNVTYAQTNQVILGQSSEGSLIEDISDPGAVNIGESLINPSSPLYFLKILRERIELVLTMDNKTKALRELEFAQRRLREVNSLNSHQRQDLIEPALTKYQLHLENAYKYSLGNEDLQVKVGEAISRHLDVLQRVYDTVGNPRAKLSIKNAIEKAEAQNRTLLEKLNLAHQQQLAKLVAVRQAFACKFLLRESTSSALNALEKKELKESAESCKKGLKTYLMDELMDLKSKKQKSASPSSY